MSLYKIDDHVCNSSSVRLFYNMHTYTQGDPFRAPIDIYVFMNISFTFNMSSDIIFVLKKENCNKYIPL